jgi:hypothetical protein
MQVQIQQVFGQLNDVLHRLSDEQYVAPCERLLNATIGQHVRHIIELVRCLEKGYYTGIINYDKRERSQLIQTDRKLARKILSGIYTSVLKPDKTLLLEASYGEETEETLLIGTNYYREMVYNLEHAVHHMALIRIGINEVSNIHLSADFGVAASTIKYKRACAQ